MKKINVMLGMPSVGSIPMQTVTCIEKALKSLPYLIPMHVSNSLVYTARDLICEKAVEMGFDYVMFIDSDMIFEPSDIEDLILMDKDIVSGSYVTRVGEPRLVAYKQVIKRTRLNPPKIVNCDIKGDELEEVAAVGMGFCLIKVSLLRKMYRDYVSLFEPKWGLGEDIAFCERARQYSPIVLSRKIKLGHLGTEIKNVPCDTLDEQIGIKVNE